MKRETIIAVMLGVAMGAIIAFILILNVREKAIKEKKIISLKPSPTVAVVKNDTQTLVISSPANEASSDKNSIKIKGKAAKNSLIIIQSALTEKFLKLEKNDFETDFSLSLGQNSIKITAYHDKTIEEKMLQIYYVEN